MFPNLEHWPQCGQAAKGSMMMTTPDGHSGLGMAKHPGNHEWASSPPGPADELLEREERVHWKAK